MLGEYLGRDPAPTPVLCRRIRRNGFVHEVQKDISSSLMNPGEVAQYVELGDQPIGLGKSRGFESRQGMVERDECFSRKKLRRTPHTLMRWSLYEGPMDDFLPLA